MTVFTNGTQISSNTIAAGTAGTASGSSGSYLVKLEPAGAIGPNASYTITATYPFVIPARKRPARH
jgi:hypothetical protein